MVAEQWAARGIQQGLQNMLAWAAQVTSNMVSELELRNMVAKQVGLPGATSNMVSELGLRNLVAKRRETARGNIQHGIGAATQ